MKNSAPIQDIIWEPSEELIQSTNIYRFMQAHQIKDYDTLIRRSIEDIEWFWDAALTDLKMEWYKPYDKVLDLSSKGPIALPRSGTLVQGLQGSLSSAKGFPWTQWFCGGKTNIVLNCLDRHLPRLKNKTAFIWESDEGESKKITYGSLSEDVNRCANLLKSLGVTPGDKIGLYLPMIPEMVTAFFACLKIGAVVIPVFSGFGARALATRLEDAKAKILFTADGGFRRGKKVAIKQAADESLAYAPSIKHMIVVQHTGDEIPWQKRRDLWWHEGLSQHLNNCPTEELEAESESLIIYTSGTTGRPKGTVHTHAGCLAQMMKELGYNFDVKESDVFFWVTDIGWMMGPWEMIGVLAHGGTFTIFEGAPDYPNPGRLWDMVDRHKISILGISPTAVRLIMRAESKWVEEHNLSSLRILGSTGETWDPDSYQWFFENVGKSRCPIMNISGGTEIVGCLLAPLPIKALKSCTLQGPALGMDVDVFDESGQPIRGGIGHLVCKQPAPSMTKGFLNDPQRYLDTYFSKWPEVWYHGDWAKVDEDGFWFLQGRADDTIKVAGKRTGPAEIEAALIEHASVSEAAAIGIPHEIKGEEVACFVVLKPDITPNDELRETLKDQVVAIMGKTLRPRDLKFVTILPKTRSAKIVRGVIRKKYLGQDLGDIASVENPEAIEEIDKAL
jgi:acetyl-CoA synthetase